MFFPPSNGVTASLTRLLELRERERETERETDRQTDRQTSESKS